MRQLEWKRSDVFKEDWMETFFDRIRESGAASGRIIASVMTLDIWSHAGNGVHSYAQKQRSRWATERHKAQLAPAVATHAASSTQLAAPNEVGTKPT